MAATQPVAPAAPAVAPSSVSPWLTLSAMSGSTTAATAAAAAAQGEEDEGMGWPPLPVLAVILATIGVAIFILVDDDDSSFGADAISPG